MIHQFSAPFYQNQFSQSQMLELRDKLLTVERDRISGNAAGYTLEQLDACLDDVIAGV